MSRNGAFIARSVLLTVCMLLAAAFVAPPARAPAVAAVTSAAVYGADANPTGDPIGGGPGYSHHYSPTDPGAVTVSSASELSAALDSATSGDIIWIPSGCTITISTAYGKTVRSGVILASNRGQDGAAGGRILWTYVAGNGGLSPLLNCQSNCVISGLTIEGPTGCAESESGAGNIALMGQTGAVRIEVENCEISKCAWAGVYFHGGGMSWDDDSRSGRHWVHHSYIHNCQRHGYGYGISEEGGCSLLAECNIFEDNRHHVMAQASLVGSTPNNYELRYNRFNDVRYGYAGNPSNLWANQQVDCHGSDSGDPGYNAGGTLRIHHNTFTNNLSTGKGNYQNVRIRGVPKTVCEVYNNWTQKATHAGPYTEVSPKNAAFQQSNTTSFRNMSVHDNWYGTAPPPKAMARGSGSAAQPPPLTSPVATLRAVPTAVSESLAPAGDFYVPTTACPTIQAGIDAAADAGGGTVHVAAGTYHELIRLMSDVVIQGAGADVTTINGDVTGDGAGDGSVVTAIDVGPPARLDGFTITNGTGTWTSTPNESHNYGGGMYNQDSSPAVANCTFSGNTIAYEGNAFYGAGGGMYNEGGSPTVSNCVFSGNKGYFDGGGISNSSGAQCTVTGCSFSGNSADFGASISNNAGASCTVDNCTFSNNTANWGAGGISNAGSATATGCTFTGNAAYWYDCYGYGGGMYNTGLATVTDCVFSGNHGGGCGYGGGVCNFGSATLSGCTFSGNSGQGDGGGMYNVGPAAATGCTFSGNQGDCGGGVLNDGGTISNCVFSSNSGSNGGGLYNIGGIVTNCAFSSNQADFGGGMLDAAGTVTNCTFTGNHGSSGGGMYILGSSSAVFNCVLWGDTPDEVLGQASVRYCDVDMKDPAAGPYAGAGNINADPLFLDAANGNIHLAQGSPCIDAGSNAAPELPGTDFEGDPRVVDGNADGSAVVDMGSDERTGALPPWDINSDAAVNYKDLAILGSAYGTTTGDAGFRPAADINQDSAVNYKDLAILGAHYGETC